MMFAHNGNTGLLLFVVPPHPPPGFISQDFAILNPITAYQVWRVKFWKFACPQGGA